MAKRQVKEKEATKDGRSWMVDLSFKDYLGRRKRYHSKKFATRREAKDHEAEYKTNIKNLTEFSDITFKQLIDEHYNYQLDKVKTTTLYNYKNMMVYLEPLYNIKIDTFNIRHYELWRQYMNEKNISLRYKNDIYKFLKSILNFGVKWHNLNFQAVYNKMTKFQDPNERRKEMAYYTYDEFKKFISYEEDLRWKCVFEILYYCGLRKGELKGLTWKDIYFDKKVLSVNKQITQRNNRVKFEFSDTKTRDSRRIVPIAKVLLNDLKMLYEQDKKDYYGFNDDFFVVSDAKPIADSNIYLRRTRLATLAGLKVIRIHDFRHSCASLLINNGANVTLVAKYLGHTKIEETLNTYSHMFSTALDSVVSVIDSLEDD